MSMKKFKITQKSTQKSFWGIEVIVEKEFFIYEIEAHETKNKNLIGTSYGRDLGHCVYIASKYDKDFLKKAKWYYIFEKQPDSIKVDFYGE